MGDTDLSGTTGLNRAIYRYHRELEFYKSIGDCAQQGSKGKGNDDRTCAAI